jgi:UMF1 family MFS transporter
MTDQYGPGPAGSPPLVAGLELQADRVIPRKQVIAWASWDWGSAAFNAVVTTFVFTVYLTSTKGFGGTDFVSTWLGWALGIAGVLVALIAPITGQKADGAGRRKFWLAIETGIVVLCVAGLFFVEPKPSFLWIGLALLAVGTLFYEIAAVNYNAMLVQVSTPKNIGRVSGLGWASGYFGGIVLLLILYFGFIHPDVGLFGVTSANGQSVRVSMLLAALWFAIFALPVLLAVPEYRAPTGVERAKVGVLGAYRRLFGDIRSLWGESRHTVYFLLASAVFRDGLTGVFTFGGVLAAGTFGFSAGEVIIFAIAANVVAGLSTVIVGSRCSSCTRAARPSSGSSAWPSASSSARRSRRAAPSSPGSPRPAARARSSASTPLPDAPRRSWHRPCSASSSRSSGHSTGGSWASCSCSPWDSR